jgi:hypothetical protein
LSTFRYIIPILLNLLAGGCGLFVPEIQDFPATAPDGQLLVQAIITSVHCEVADAVKAVIDADRLGAAVNGRRSAAWLDHWGAQMTLTLTVEEKSTLNPTAVWTPLSPPTSIFTLAGTATLSSDATRTEKLNFYYTVPQLYKRAPCTTGIQPQAPATSLLIQSDLKLKEWLFDQLPPVGTGEVNQPISPGGVFKQNVLSHEVKFEVVSAVGITPAWKLIRANFNQTGPLFATMRDRIHDLLITFGPIDPTQINGGLVTAATNSHLASEVGLSVSNNLRAVTIVPTLP